MLDFIAYAGFAAIVVLLGYVSLVAAFYFDR